MTKQKTTNKLQKSLAGLATLAMVLTLANVSPAFAKNGADDTGADDRGGARKSSSSKSSSSKKEDSGRNKAEDGGVHQNRNRGAFSGALEDNPNRLNDDDGIRAQTVETGQAHSLENKVTEAESVEIEAGDVAEAELAGQELEQELGDDNAQLDANDDNQEGLLGALKNKVLAFFGGLFN